MPHVIVALNAADFNVSDEEWDENNATANLLNAVRNSWYRRPSISDLAETWRRRGRIIRTISDLIHCYYSSFTVVRIPVEGRYNLLKDQLDKLSANITNCCEASFRGKRRARMLLNSDELGMFLQSAFDHFSQDLENPFNFIEVSLRNNPIPKDFGGNVLQLAIAVQQADRNTYGEWIFGRLSYVVASSVLLDCVRNRKGKSTSYLQCRKDFECSSVNRPSAGPFRRVQTIL